MDTDRIARLTDKQRECLRLVNLHQSSKMIAPLLGITPEAVDQRTQDGCAFARCAQPL